MKRISIIACSLILLIGCGKTSVKEVDRKPKDKTETVRESSRYTVFCDSGSDDIVSMRYYVEDDNIVEGDAIMLQKGIVGVDAMSDEEIIEMMLQDFSNLDEYSKGITVTVEEGGSEKAFAINFPDLKTAPDEVKRNFGISNSLSFEDVKDKLDPAGTSCKVE